MNVRYEIKHIRRKEIWDYPIPALREALLNALVHRNYFDIANFTLIKFYDDHIWFTNPGKLVDGITIDELKKPHNSFSRNPLITKIFYLCGYIEHYGSGTVRMVEWMKKAGLPEPEYKEELGGLSVYFHKDIYAEENLRKMGLNERQIKAVAAVKEKGKITNKEYRGLTGLSDEGARIDLNILVEKDIIVPKGSGRNTHYILK